MARTMITIDYPTTEAGMAKAAIAEAIARGDHDWAAMLQTKLSKFVGAPREAHATMFEVDDNKGRDTSDAPRRMTPMAKEGQLNLIRILLADLDKAGKVDAEYTSWVKARVDNETLSAAQASAVIGDLKKALGRDVNPRFILQQHERGRVGVPTLNLTDAPRAEVVEVTAPVTPAAPAKKKIELPDGYYAIPGEGDVIDFFMVKTTKKGFVRFNRCIGGSPTDTPVLVPVRWAAALDYAAKIEAYGIDASKMLYAEKLERCHHCNRQLTDDESRARGMGRTCARKA